MNPVGDYRTFYDEFLRKYDDYADNEIISFGILLADYRQTATREYILNYLQDFDYLSGKLIDFFIPGYIEAWNVGWCTRDTMSRNNGSIQVRGTDYVFVEEIFRSFIHNLQSQFGIRYTYNPMLILMSMERCYIQTARYIVFELDTIPGGIRRSGELFRRIFDVAREDTSLEAYRNRCYHIYIKDNIVEKFSAAIGLPWLEEITRVGTEYKRYKIRSIFR